MPPCIKDKAAPPSIPTSVRVLGRNVSVVVEKSAVLNQSVMGLHKVWDNTITLDSNLAPDQMKAIAVHEIVHDIEAVTGVAMSEQDVTSFSSVLFAVLRDNPDLVKWLMS